MWYNFQVSVHIVTDRQTTYFGTKYRSRAYVGTLHVIITQRPLYTVRSTTGYRFRPVHTCFRNRILCTPKQVTLYPETGYFVAVSGDFIVINGKFVSGNGSKISCFRIQSILFRKEVWTGLYDKTGLRLVHTCFRNRRFCFPNRRFCCRFRLFCFGNRRFCFCFGRFCFQKQIACFVNKCGHAFIPLVLFPIHPFSTDRSILPEWGHLFAHVSSPTRAFQSPSVPSSSFPISCTPPALR